MSDIVERIKSEGLNAKKRYRRREKDLVVRDIITALAVCHNVTPVLEYGVKVYQASSPDEVALVKIAGDLKMELIKRD